MRIKLGYPITLQEISDSVKGVLSFNANPSVEYICTDSRETQPKDLFIPIKGERYDGENFIEEALKIGCYTISSKNENAHIKVKTSENLLLNIASYYNKILPYIIYRIGITGSVGKTTTKEFLKVLLSGQYKVHANEGNLNNEIGLPLSILSAPQNTEILIMEMGMNHPGEISNLSKCLCPNLAIITNIGSSHIGNLGSRENIAKAKLEILDGMNGGPVYIPKEEYLLSCLKNRKTVSINDRTADYFLHSVDNSITVIKEGKPYVESRFAFTEKHLKKCLLFACATSIDVGVSTQSLKNGISNISIYNARQNMAIEGGYYFFDDSYNASIESICACFESAQKITVTGKKNLILGDVLELGDMSERMHYQIGRIIPPSLFDNIFLVGNFVQHTASGAALNGFPFEKIHINQNPDRLDITVNQIKKHCQKGDLIVMKASRKLRLERIIDYFKEGSKI